MYSFLVAALALGGGLLSRGRWWLFRTSRAEIDDAVGATCRMTLARLTAVADRYEIDSSRGVLIVSVSRNAGVIALGFSDMGQADKKGVLIRNLLAKQFDPIIPRIRIRLRRAR